MSTEINIKKQKQMINDAVKAKRAFESLNEELNGLLVGITKDEGNDDFEKKIRGNIAGKELSLAEAIDECEKYLKDLKQKRGDKNSKKLEKKLKKLLELIRSQDLKSSNEINTRLAKNEFKNIYVAVYMAIKKASEIISKLTHSPAFGNSISEKLNPLDESEPIPDEIIDYAIGQLEVTIQRYGNKKPSAKAGNQGAKGENNEQEQESHGEPTPGVAEEIRQGKDEESERKNPIQEETKKPSDNQLDGKKQENIKSLLDKIGDQKFKNEINTLIGQGIISIDAAIYRAIRKALEVITKLTKLCNFENEIKGKISSKESNPIEDKIVEEVIRELEITFQRFGTGKRSTKSEDQGAKGDNKEKKTDGENQNVHDDPSTPGVPVSEVPGQKAGGRGNKEQKANEGRRIEPELPAVDNDDYVRGVPNPEVPVQGRGKQPGEGIRGEGEDKNPSNNQSGNKKQEDLDNLLKGIGSNRLGNDINSLLASGKLNIDTAIEKLELLLSILRQITRLTKFKTFANSIRDGLEDGLYNLDSAIDRAKEELEVVNQRFGAKYEPYLKVIESKLGGAELKYGQKIAMSNVLKKYINLPEFKKSWWSLKEANHLFEDIRNLVKEDRVTDNDFEKVLTKHMAIEGWINVIKEYHTLKKVEYGENEENKPSEEEQRNEEKINERVLRDYLFENYERFIKLYPTPKKLVKDQAVLSQIANLSAGKSITKESLERVMSADSSKRTWAAMDKDWRKVSHYMERLQEIWGVKEFSKETPDGDPDHSHFGVVKRIFILLRLKNYKGFNEVYPKASMFGNDKVMVNRLAEMGYDADMEWKMLKSSLQKVIVGRLVGLKKLRKQEESRKEVGNQKENPPDTDSTAKNQNKSKPSNLDLGEKFKDDPTGNAEDMIAKAGEETNNDNVKEKQKLFDDFHKEGSMIERIKNTTLPHLEGLQKHIKGVLEDLPKFIKDSRVTPENYRKIIEDKRNEFNTMKNNINEKNTKDKQQLFDNYSGRLQSAQASGKVDTKQSLAAMRGIIDDVFVSVEDYKKRLDRKCSEMGTEMKNTGEENQEEKSTKSSNDTSEKSKDETPAENKDSDSDLRNAVLPDGGDIVKKLKENRNSFKIDDNYLKKFKEEYKKELKKLKDLKISEIIPTNITHKTLLKAILDLMMTMCGLNGGKGLSKVQPMSRYIATLSVKSNGGENFNNKNAMDLLQYFDKACRLIIKDNPFFKRES